MIDLRRLRALRAVADHGTLAAAADALHLTPSAVSQQLAALERDVARPLLEPSGRSVRLTPAARVLLAHADELFAQLERLEGDLAADDDEPRGELRVVARHLLECCRRPVHQTLVLGMMIASTDARRKNSSASSRVPMCSPQCIGTASRGWILRAASAASLAVIT